MQKGETPIKFDEVGDFFYVIISGSVGIHIPNPKIKFFRENYNKYLRLLPWE